jgi:calcineurin-like phosphoesterase family protein
MSNIFFTADTHFGHTNIIKYCNRPFKDAREMDEIILQRFNEVCRAGDTLYHLGDVCHSSFSIRSFWDRLNLHQTHLILGNHDKWSWKESPHKWIQWVGTQKSISIDKIPLFLFHFPCRSWAKKGHGGLHLYGHVHGRLEGMDRSMDVGVDTNNFYPYSWEEVRERLKDIPFYKKEDLEGGWMKERIP